MGTSVIEGHHGLRTPPVDHSGYPPADDIEPLRPADPLEPPGPTRAGAFQRKKETPRAVHELTGVVRHLVADDPFRIRQRSRTLHFRDAALVDRHRQAAGVGTIEGADSGTLQHRHDRFTETTKR